MAKAKYDTIGEMDRRVQLYNYTETTNTYGERMQSFALTATVWAKVEYLGSEGIEAERAGKESAQMKVNFTIRKRADISVRSRVVFDGATYDVEGISTSQDKQFTVLRTQQIA